MNFGDAVNSSQKKVILERSVSSNNLDEKFWTYLKQVTVEAVDKAWKSKVVASSRSTNNSNKSAAHDRPPRSWNLDINSEDRRHVAAKIYALLVKWTSDFSFEWRAKVANAVRVFEEAMYEQAKSEEEYTNPSLLEPQLIRVLHHFDGGIGDYLLTKPDFDPHQQFSYPGRVSHLVAPEQVEDKRKNGREAKETELLCRRGAWESPFAGAARLPTKEFTGGTLCTSAGKAVHKDRHKVKDKGSIKSGVERVIGIISKKKRRDEQIILKQETQDALAEDDIEGLATMLASTKLASDINNAAEELLSSLVETAGTSSSGDDVDLPLATSSSGEEYPPRRRRRTSLRERLQMERTISQELHAGETIPHNFGNVLFARSKEVACACGNRNEVRLNPIETPNLHSYSQDDHVPMGTGESDIQVQIASSSILSRTGNVGIERIGTTTTDDRQSEKETNNQCRQSGVRTVANLQRQDSSRETTEPTEDFIIQERSAEQISPTAEGQGSQICDGDDPRAASATDASGGNSNRVSLMRLLAEGDEESRIMNQYDICANSALHSLASWETWEDPTEQLDPICCICMVGLKGAALVPCGHTFCRRCSRELCRGRATCPLCNRFILEILDIY